MRTSRFKRALGASLAVISALAMGVVALAPEAHASTPPGTYTDVLAAAGSDTIQSFMNDYFATPDAQAVDTHTRNILVPPNLTGVFNVPADANCGSQDYVASGPTGNQKVSPNGSGQGRTALVGWAAGRSSRQLDVPVLRLRARRRDLGQPEPAGSGHHDGPEPA